MDEKIEQNKYAQKCLLRVLSLSTLSPKNKDDKPKRFQTLSSEVYTSAHYAGLRLKTIAF